MSPIHQFDMAVARESVHQSPTSETSKNSFPQAGVDLLGQGQYALSTCVEVVCDNHKNTKAVIKLSGNFSVEYSQDAGLVQR